MQSIRIEFIAKNSINIYIDDEKLADVTGISLEMRVGENEKYCIEKNILKQQKRIENRQEYRVENWRTIPKAIQELKEEDPKTDITGCNIRKLVEERKIPFTKDGRTTKIELNALKEYYRNSYKMEAIEVVKPKIKPIF